MPHFEELYPSRFLKGVTLARPLTIRMKEFRPEKLEDDKGAMVPKAILAYVDRNGPGEMVCCKTNAALIAAIYGPDYKTWIDKLITVHFDPNVKFGSEKPGGIRVLGSPSLTEAMTVTIKRPRRKKVETYILQPTGAQAAAQAKAEAEQAAAAAAAESIGTQPASQPPPVEKIAKPEPARAAKPAVPTSPPVITSAVPAAAAPAAAPALASAAAQALAQPKANVAPEQERARVEENIAVAAHAASAEILAAPVAVDSQSGHVVPAAAPAAAPADPAPAAVAPSIQTGEAEVTQICKEIFALTSQEALIEYCEGLAAQRESGRLKLTKDQGQRIRQTIEAKAIAPPIQTGEAEVTQICKEIFALTSQEALIEYCEGLAAQRESGRLKLTKDQGQRIRQTIEAKAKTLAAAAVS